MFSALPPPQAPSSNPPTTAASGSPEPQKFSTSLVGKKLSKPKPKAKAKAKANKPAQQPKATKLTVDQSKKV